MADMVTATRRPRRYLAVGLICAALHNLLMLIADSMGIYYMLAMLLSAIVVIPTGYALHSLYTFERKVALARFARFTGGVLSGFPLSFVLMIALVSGLGLPVPIATLIATISLFVWNYVATRWAILLHREESSQTG